MDAEVRIGEILSEMPKASGGDRKSFQAKIKIDSAVDFDSIPTKQEAIESLGFNQKQAERFQVLAANQDLVEQIKQEARESDDLPTRTAVLQAARIKQYATITYLLRNDAAVYTQSFTFALWLR